MRISDWSSDVCSSDLFAIAVQRAGGAVGDSMMEIDSDGNENAAPRQRVAISNFTFVHRNAAVGNGAAIRVRGGADYSFANGLIVSDMACLRIESAHTVPTRDRKRVG